MLIILGWSFALLGTSAIAVLLGWWHYRTQHDPMQD